jgi:hypothetical protein
MKPAESHAAGVHATTRHLDIALIRGGSGMDGMPERGSIADGLGTLVQTPRAPWRSLETATQTQATRS